MAKTSRKKEIAFAVAMSLLSAALLARALLYPPDSSQFPRFLMILQLLFSILLLGKALKIPKGERKEPSDKRSASLAVAFQVFLATSAYLLAIQYIGYFVSTALFLCGAMYWFGKHKPIVLFAVSAGFIVTIYALFVLFIGVRLPRGILL